MLKQYSNINEILTAEQSLSAQRLQPQDRNVLLYPPNRIDFNPALYPNPGSGKVTIGNLDKISDINEIRISNSLGQLVEVINNTSFDGSTKLLLDISKYEHGLYFLNIRISDRSIVKKLLIE